MYNKFKYSKWNNYSSSWNSPSSWNPAGMETNALVDDIKCKAENNTNEPPTTIVRNESLC